MDGVNWLWPGWLPRGRTTLLAGAGGSGKGTLAGYLMACATNRKPWPDRTRSEPCVAVMVSPDDALADMLKPRLHHSGVDFDLCKRLQPDAIRYGINRIFNDLRRSSDRDIGLIVIDMLQAGMARGTDGNAAGDVAGHLSSYNALAEELDAAVVVVHHINKWVRTKVADGSLANLVRGSGAWTDAVRMVWMMAADENDPAGSRILVRAKCNVGGVRWHEGGYRIASRDEHYQGDNGIPGTTTVVDDVTAISGKAHDIFVAAVERDQPAAKTVAKKDAAVDAIVRQLSPGKPTLKGTVMAALQAKGHADRTIDRAAKVMAHDRRLLIRKAKRDEFAGANANAVVWELP